MRSIGWHVAAAGAAFAWVAIAACVGDDPGTSSSANDSGPATGEFQGPCKDGLCLAGLSCVEGICLHADGSSGGSDAANDATSDAGLDADTDEDADADAATADICPVGDVEAGAAQNPCPASGSSASSSSSGAVPPPPSTGTCAKGNVCCIGAQAYNYCGSSSTSCISAGGKPYGCSSTGTCGNGQVCCLAMLDAGANPKVTDNCPRTIAKSGFEAARCETTACAANETRICRGSSECTAPAQCRRVLFTTGDGTITLGVCL